MLSKINVRKFIQVVAIQSDNRSLFKMKLYYIIAVVLFLLIGFKANASQSIKGDCYLSDIKYEQTNNENTLTICIDNNNVVERMLYSNKGGIPVVCYQKGSVTKSLNTAYS
jgi:hypothetical protein